MEPENRLERTRVDYDAVAQAYDALSAKDPRWTVLDATLPPDELLRQALT